MLKSPSASPSLHAGSPRSRPHLQQPRTQTRSPRTSPHSFRKPSRYPPSSPSPNTSALRSRPEKAAAAAATTAPSPRLSRAPTTADAGTQYTPPDWPPTSSRSSLRQPQPPAESNPRAREAVSSATPSATVAAAASSSSTPNVASPTAPIAPSEPRLRQTPRTSLTDAPEPTSSRRSRSSTSPTADYPAASSSNGHDHVSSSNKHNHISPSKRHRADPADLQLVPRDYTSCPPQQLASMISDLILDLIRVNDSIPPSESQLTRFHSRVPPTISVHAYLTRLTYHATLSPPLLLSMVSYIDTLCGKYPAFTVNSLTVHRFLITAATCAAKALSDAFWTNTQYAKVGGVSLRELAMLELELLERMEWEMVPRNEGLEGLYEDLVGRSGGVGFEMEEEEEGEGSVEG
ncbi:MAG: hypothetical protein M1828_003563 [Chrysothrix sp. TS-e1954]|nr:MAG: hypothetical protein M1828_003563 [Chrysothrix sp. TS-e1954]